VNDVPYVNKSKKQAGDGRRCVELVGSKTMVESTRSVQSRDPFDRFDEAISDPRLYQSNRYEQPYDERAPYDDRAYAQERPYALPYQRPQDLPPQEPVPLFLSGYEEEHQQVSEYAFASGSRKFGSGGLKQRTPVWRIVSGVVAVSAIGALLALFSVDSTRAVIFQASLGGNSSAQFGAAQPEPAEPQQQPQQPRIAAPPVAAEAPAPAPVQAPDATAGRRTTPVNALASASPTRDEITTAYQTATKGKVAVPEPVARESAREATAPAAPAVREPTPVTREPAVTPARRIDPDELATLLKRAKGLLAIGDITSARLLLERAADAQEPEAALMLAGTYDAQVLGTQDMRSVSPDPAAARLWYQKAAQLGSADAKRRLSQLQK
jgi:hypothetical protein